MIEIQNNKILLDGKELQFDNKIIEAAEYEGKVVIVFETDEDGGYDNVFCYTQDLQLLWRIKPAPVYSSEEEIERGKTERERRER